MNDPKIVNYIEIDGKDVLFEFLPEKSEERLPKSCLSLVTIEGPADGDTSGQPRITGRRVTI